MPSLDIIKIVQQNYTTKFVEIQRIFDTLFLNRVRVVTMRHLGNHRQSVDEKSVHYV